MSHFLKPKITVRVDSPLRRCVINVINAALCNFTLLFWFIEMVFIPTITLSYYSLPSHILQRKSTFSTWEEKKIFNSHFIPQLYQVQTEMIIFESFLHFSPQFLSTTLFKIDYFASKHYKNKSQSSLLEHNKKISKFQLAVIA